MKVFFLIAGDIALLYLGLLLTLVIRYGADFYRLLVEQHIAPFSVVFLIWLAVFYIAGLYDSRRLRNNFEFLKTLWLVFSVNALLALFFFYFVPAFGITPKTNLIIFLFVSAAFETAWRRIFNRVTASSARKRRVAFIGSGAAVDEIAAALGASPQLGYEIAVFIGGPGKTAFPRTLAEWRKLIKNERLDLIIIPRHFKKEGNMSQIFCELLGSGIEVHDVPAFYETIFRKIPVAEIDNEWVLDAVANREKFYDDFKRGAEVVLAFLLGIALLPLELLIALAVKATSAGPTIYRQTRIGKNQKPFMLYKFRTMRQDAEAHGPRWAEKNDRRVTAVGRVLRYAHLDELPQLLNIAKGDLSFVGPRPERPEFAEMLAEKIPYYDIRHLVKPGFTGWAQIEYRYGASVEEAAEKLKYDLYYLKNRSLLLDVAILLKTFKLFFIKNQ